MQLRPYQQEAHDAIICSWGEFDRTLCVMPTGVGKTIVFAKVAETEVARRHRVLILAHREELINQAQDKLRWATGLETAREKADETALNSLFPVTVGSVQTLMRPARLERFPRDYYTRIIVDEAHHALSASYQSVLGYFDAAKVLGVTATPDRGDKRNLAEYFDGLAYEYLLPAAIRDGYLVPIKAQTVPLHIDIDSVRVTAGDYNDADLGSALDPYLPQIARAIADHAGGRKSVVFLPLIATSERMVEHLRAVGMDARHVCGVSQDRADVLRWFNAASPGAVLCNSMLLTEGWDEPTADCIVCLRPTKIRSLYAQIVGRGTRLSPGKTDLLLLDFLWHSTTHALCKPASLIAQDEQEYQAATAVIDAAGGSVDIGEAIEEGKRNARLEREKALARQLEEKRNRKARTIDPLEFALAIHDDDIEAYGATYKWERKKPSERQLEVLAARGFAPEDIQDRGHASLLLDKIITRSQLNLASPKQIKLLAKFGVDAGMMPFAQASAEIDRIARNGWRV